MEYIWIYIYHIISYLPEYLRKTYPNTSGYRENDDEPLDFQVFITTACGRQGTQAMLLSNKMKNLSRVLEGGGNESPAVTKKHQTWQTVLSKECDAALKKSWGKIGCQNHQTTLGRWVEGRGHLDKQNRIYLSQESPAFFWSRCVPPLWNSDLAFLNHHSPDVSLTTGTSEQQAQISFQQMPGLIGLPKQVGSLCNCCYFLQLQTPNIAELTSVIS